jgi:hypothetical protein
MGPIAALCLEAAAPLALAASQLLYATGPFLGARAMRLGRLLESEDGVSELARYLVADEDGLPLDTGTASD